MEYENIRIPKVICRVMVAAASLLVLGVPIGMMSWEMLHGTFRIGWLPAFPIMVLSLVRCWGYVVKGRSL